MTLGFELKNCCFLNAYLALGQKFHHCSHGKAGEERQGMPVTFPCGAMSLQHVLHSPSSAYHQFRVTIFRAAGSPGLFHVTLLGRQRGCDSTGLEERPALPIPAGRTPAWLIPCCELPQTVSLWCKHSWGRRGSFIFKPFVVVFTPTAPSAFSAYAPARAIIVFYTDFHLQGSPQTWPAVWGQPHLGR